MRFSMESILCGEDHGSWIKAEHDSGLTSPKKLRAAELSASQVQITSPSPAKGGDMEWVELPREALKNIHNDDNGDFTPENTLASSSTSELNTITDDKLGNELSEERLAGKSVDDTVAGKYVWHRQESSVGGDRPGCSVHHNTGRPLSIPLLPPSSSASLSPSNNASPSTSCSSLDCSAENVTQQPIEV
ncbi:hypothetical protein AB6A40_007847, partial [Gnathostoma spinigerum]